MEFGAKSRENRSILKDIKKWIQEFMDRIRRPFKNVMPDSKAAQEFDPFDQQTKQLLADKFVDMIQDSGEKLSTIKAAGMSEQYQYLIEFKENKTPGISNTAVNKPPASKPSVLQGQYTQSGGECQQKFKTGSKNAP